MFFGDKGVILRSSISSNVKIVLAIAQAQDGLPEAPLVKILVRRNTETLNRKGTSPYKAWLSGKEVSAVIHSLQRVLVLMDEMVEGTLDLTHHFMEDEDTLLMVKTPTTAAPTIENMFASKKEEEPEGQAIEVDPSDLF